MASFIDVRTDSAEFARMLRQLPKGFDAKFLTKLLVFSAKPMVQKAQNNAPLDTGVLSESI